MKKIAGLLFSFIMICAFGITSLADNTVDEFDIDEIYEEAYDNCRKDVAQIIEDDYDAYSYLLSKNSEVSFSDGVITVEDTFFVDLNEHENIYVKDFIRRLNRLSELGAITIDCNLALHTKEAPNNTKPLLRRVPVIDLMSEARYHAAELKEVYDNAVFGTAHAVAGLYFTARVRSGGIWDYKVFLGTTNRYLESELGATMTGETIGNFHYGYVGSVCFGETTLKSAAGLAQICGGTSDLSYWSSYFDDPRDQSDIEWGINVYKGEH